MTDYDIIVLGAGPGGYVAADRWPCWPKSFAH